MAIRWLAPTSACVATSSGSITGSAGKYAWLGLAASAASAMAAFYRSASATEGRQLWTLTAAACSCTSAPVPFSIGSSGVYVTLTGAGASALVAMK